MATMMAHPGQMTSTPPNPDAEPDDAWKLGLRKQIEESLLPMVKEAKEALQQKLGEAPVDQVTRDRLANEHSDTLKNIRRIADDLYRDQIDQERQQLRWAQGGTVERGWSEGIVKQQQAILEQIERQKANKPPQQSRPGSNVHANSIHILPVVHQVRQHPQWTPTDNFSPDREPEYFNRPTNNRNSIPVSPGRSAEDRMMSRPRGSSGGSMLELRYHADKPTVDYSRPAFMDEPEEMDRPDRFPEKRASLRRQNSNAGPKPIPEIWKPSISPEEDAVMSRTSQLARRGSVASIQSGSYRSPSATYYADRPDLQGGRQNSISSPGPNSYRPPSATQPSDRPEQTPMARKTSITSIGSYNYRPPSTNQIPERSEPPQHNIDVAAKAERERSDIRASEEEWSDMNKARDRQISGRGPESRFRSGSGARQSEDYTNIPSPASAGPISPSAPPLSSTSWPVEISRVPRPSTLTASRPNSHDDHSFVMDDTQRSQPPPNSSSQGGGWADPQRAQSRTRPEPNLSRSPPSITEESNPRHQYQQHYQPRSRVSMQDLRHGHHAPVMVRQTSDQEVQAPDLDDNHGLEDQQWRSDLETDQSREEESKRREEESRRNEDMKRMEAESQRKETAMKKKEEAAKKKEVQMKRKEEEAKRKEEEARRKAEEEKRKEEEEKRKEEEEKRAEEARRREEEAKRREEEAKREREEARREKEEAKRREEEVKRKEEETRLLELEVLRRAEEAQQKQEEAERHKEEARRRAAEAERMQREALAKEEAAKLLEEETRKKEEEIRVREELVKKREEELERREKEAHEREQEKLRKQREETRLRNEETRKRNEEARIREQEVRRKEAAEKREQEARQLEDARKKQEERQFEEVRKREEARIREQAVRRMEAEKREADVKRRERDLERREAEAKRKEEERDRQERLEEAEAIRQVQEMERREAEASAREQVQQMEFRKREEEIRRRAYERRSQEEYEFLSDSRIPSAKISASPPASSPWPIPNSRASAGTPSQADRNSGTTASSWTSNSSRPGFNGTPTSSARTSTSSTAAKPIPAPAWGAAYPGSGTSPLHSVPSEEEWARRQEEQARKQQEAFRREQEQQEMKRQAQMGKILSKDDVLQLFEVHERQWAALPTLDELGWYSFPWPVWKKPRDPEDLTSTHIGAYVLSQYYPGDNAKSSKDRIKEHIRRWHPDRFETKYLPKVRLGDREKVKVGAGVVVRVLNEMLTRSNVHDMFS